MDSIIASIKPLAGTFLRRKIEKGVFQDLGSCSKTPIAALCRLGGGGYPPLPLLKNLLKFGPKTVFFRQKTLFLVKKFQAACRYGGGGTPPCRFFFWFTFWPAACRDAHHGKKP